MPKSEEKQDCWCDDRGRSKDARWKKTEVRF